MTHVLTLALLVGLLEAAMSTLNADTPRVDFSYSFAPPHRLTAARPDSGDKTLLDLQPGSLRMAWSYEDLTRYPFGTFMTPPTHWDIGITPTVEGKAFPRSRWSRTDGWLPALDNRYEGDDGSIRLEVTAAASAAVMRITLTNDAGKPRRFALTCESRAWGENPAWADPDGERGDCLVAGWNERADRVLLLGIGAVAYTLREDHRAPGPRTLLMVWDLKPGETTTAWLVRPYRGYAADLPALRKHDWAAEVAAARREWLDLLARAAAFTVPDDGVANAFRACLADLFVMREPVGGGHIAAAPGTEVYRAANAFEAGIVAIALDQMGLHHEADQGYRLCVEMQEPDGNWNDAKGWGHLMWGGAGFKAWAVMQHYRLTGDRNYLERVYPHMLASSRWNEKQRARTRSGAPGVAGLMPRGMGDCGLKDGDDLYGVFLPHNIWAVYSDRLALEAAEALDRHDDAAELRRVYGRGRQDLLAAVEHGAIQEQGYRWIPGVPGKTSGSRWGVLNALYPCGLLPGDDPLVQGTLRHLEGHLSPGGIPMNTGWLTNGMWVAITLDNVAEARLALGDGDGAARYLYACLNHGTPLMTWCEERGPEPGTTTCTGDRQHLWTPVAVVRCLRDMLVMEQDDGLHLALGTAREWLATGQPVGVRGAPTHHGSVTYSMQYDAATGVVRGDVTFARGSAVPQATLHVRLPGGLRVRGVDPASGATVLSDGTALRWEHPTGKHEFVAQVGP